VSKGIAQKDVVVGDFGVRISRFKRQIGKKQGIHPNQLSRKHYLGWKEMEENHDEYKKEINYIGSQLRHTGIRRPFLGICRWG
jgi:hypothetical protein